VPEVAIPGRSLPRQAGASARPWARPALTWRWAADAGAVLALLVFTAFSYRDLGRGAIVVGLDTLTQYYPWYAFLGEQLRSGQVPGWNPHAFSGAPFAADPLSGWTYLPAMGLFSMLPLEAAAAAFQALHVLLAGVFTYALARALGLIPGGAFLAGTAYAHSGFFALHTVCCAPFVSVATWLPLVLLGCERAVRAPDRAGRARWWAIAGLALSQIFASWPGQGAYYAGLAIGGYLFYRTLIAPLDPSRRIGARFGDLARHGAATFALGIGLAAAGMLPRWEYWALSSLADGYAATDLHVGGWVPSQWATLWTPGYWYVGIVVLFLSACAPIVCRGRFGVPYWTALAFAVLLLTGHQGSPLYPVLALLPGFAGLHAHLSERVMIVFFIAPAILAGATLSELWTRRRFAATTAAWVAVLAVGLILAVASGAAPVVLATLAFAGTIVFSPLPAIRGVVGLALVLLVFVDLQQARGAAISAYAGAEGVHQFLHMDLRELREAPEGLRYLHARVETETFRFLGYVPARNEWSHTQRFAEPAVLAVGANNGAIVAGLEDVQGYNPLHLRRYDEYLAALNARSQNYHNADVFEQGLDSRLLDLLNVRYIVTPASEAGDGAQSPLRRYAEVYRDREVVILENRHAFPRAWIVHQAQQVGRGEALALLTAGAVDPRQMALLEEPLPLLGQPADATRSAATIVARAPDHLTLRTSGDAPGLLVLSEVHHPAWRATVDGRETSVLVANHALRAVPVPSGTHTVELRYDSATLNLGMAISLAFALILVALVAAPLWVKYRARREELASLEAPGEATIAA
jgi:hypothetical protein